MSRIDRVDVLVTDFASRQVRRVSSGVLDTGPAGSVIGKPVLVRVHAGGKVGSGQVRPVSPSHFSPESVHSVVSAVRDFYAPVLIGRSIFDLDAAWAQFDKILPGNQLARAAIDCAMHDVAGQILEVPVYQLLGGLSQSRIPLEWSISMADTPGEMVDDARQAIDGLGLSALCLKAGGPEGWRRDVENFRAVRDAVGDDVVIAIDPNTGWSVPEAISVTRELHDADVAYLEQPTDRWDIAGMAHLRRSSQGIPIAADESVCTLRDAFDLAAAQAVDIFCLKIYKMGGLRAAKSIANFAAAANLKLTLGGTAFQSQLEAAACAHLFASIPASTLLSGAEFIFGVGVGGDDPLVAQTDFRIVDGAVDVPDGPGLGVILDEALVAKYTLEQFSVS